MNGKELTGKTALVTGAGTGIGSAIATALADKGASVAIHYLKSRNGAELLSAALSEKARCRAYCADVTDVAAVEQMVSQVEKDFGRVDILVNNAAVEWDEDLADMQAGQWQRVVDVNLTGVFHCTRIAARAMVKHSYGRIINVSSVCAIKGFDGNTAYSATKSALMGFTRSLAKELGPYGILVNTVLPGLVDAGMSRRMVERIGEQNTRELINKIPLHRACLADEVGYLVAFLASGKAGYITGQNIVIDGGFSC